MNYLWYKKAITLIKLRDLRSVSDVIQMKYNYGYKVTQLFSTKPSFTNNNFCSKVNISLRPPRCRFKPVLIASSLFDKSVLFINITCKTNLKTVSTVFKSIGFQTDFYKVVMLQY